LLGLAVLTAHSLGAQNLAALDSVVPALMKRHDVPGMALAIVRGDSIVALRG
jgi:CubicO group peptidase (beta-lactamase class C family)